MDKTEIMNALIGRVTSAAGRDPEPLLGLRVTDDRVLDFLASQLPIEIEGNLIRASQLTVLVEEDEIVRFIIEHEDLLPRGLEVPMSLDDTAAAIGAPTVKQGRSAQWLAPDVFLHVEWKKKGRRIERVVLARPTARELLDAADDLVDASDATDQDLERALAFYDFALEHFPVHAVSALHGIAVGCTNLQRYEDAVAATDRAIALEPTHGGVLWARYGAMRKVGRDADAIAELDRLLASDPSFWHEDAVREVAFAHFEVKDYEGAVARWHTILERVEGSHDDFFKLAEALAFGGRFAEALEIVDAHWDDADPGDFEYWIRGLAREGTGDLAGARADFTIGAELGDDDAKAKLAAA
jgi:tetratricopeptide (TPR) repeat protein